MDRIMKRQLVRLSTGLVYKKIWNSNITLLDKL